GGAAHPNSGSHSPSGISHGSRAVADEQDGGYLHGSLPRSKNWNRKVQQRGDQAERRVSKDQGRAHADADARDDARSRNQQTARGAGRCTRRSTLFTGKDRSTGPVEERYPAQRRGRTS